MTLSDREQLFTHNSTSFRKPWVCSVEKGEKRTDRCYEGLFPGPLANSTFVSKLQWVHLKGQGKKHQHSYPPIVLLLSNTLSPEFLYFPFEPFIQLSGGTKRNYLVFKNWLMDAVGNGSFCTIFLLLLPMQANKLMYSLL